MRRPRPRACYNAGGWGGSNRGSESSREVETARQTKQRNPARREPISNHGERTAAGLHFQATRYQLGDAPGQCGCALATPGEAWRAGVCYATLQCEHQAIHLQYAGAPRTPRVLCGRGPGERHSTGAVSLPRNQLLSPAHETGCIAGIGSSGPEPSQSDRASGWGGNRQRGPMLPWAVVRMGLEQLRYGATTRCHFPR